MRFYAEFSVFDEVERHDIAVTDTTEYFWAFDFVVEVIFNDFNKFFGNGLVRAIRRNFGSAEVRRKYNYAFAEIDRFALAVGQPAVFKNL